jgi:WD40 repeat protein
MTDPKPPPPTLYTLKDPPTPPVAVTLPDSVNRIAMVPGGRAVLCVDDIIPASRKVLVLEMPSGKVLKTFPAPGVSLASIAVFPDGKTALVGGMDDNFDLPARRYIRRIDLNSGATVGTLAGPKQMVEAVAISRDGTLVASGEKFPAYAVRVYEVKTGAERFAHDKAHTNVFYGLAFTPDNKYLISAGVDLDGRSKSKVIVWDIAAGKEKHVFTGYPGTAEGIAVSANGKWVAAAINEPLTGGSVRVWDVETGAEKLTLIGKGLNRGGHKVVFGPEDRTVIALFYTGDTRVFEVETGREVGGVRGHVLMANLLAMTPDGKNLVTVYFKDMKIWDFPDSLQKLGKPDAPPFVQTIIEGKEVEANPAGPGPGTNVKRIASATVEGLEAKTRVLLSADGAAARVSLQAGSRFFDASGKQLSAADATRVYRIGNVVAITAGGDAQDEVLEMRLVREGPAERVLEKVFLMHAQERGASFTVQEKSISVNYDPSIRLLKADGQEAAGVTAQRFLLSNPLCNITLRLVAAEEKPLLSEIRALPSGPPESRPIDVPGAKQVKNAVVTRIGEPGGVTRLALVVAGEAPITVYYTAATKAYDLGGKPVAARDVFTEGARVDAIYVPRDAGRHLLEIRQAGVIDLPPKKPQTVEHKNVEVTKAGNGHAFLRINRKNHLLLTDSSSKAFNRAGRAVPLEEILQNGNRVDAIVEPLPQLSCRLIEVRPAAGP